MSNIPPSCLPSHLLQQYGEVGHESKGTPVSDGADIGATLNTYTHLGLEDAVDELLENAKKEMEKINGEGEVSQKMFQAI